jgi:uncharacterized protein (DUF1684 family)
MLPGRTRRRKGTTMLGKTDREREEYVKEVTKFRREKDRYFGASDESPIPHAERHAGFAGLSYYPPDPAFRVQAAVVPFANPEVVRLATSTGEVRPQQRYAELRFRIGDRDLRLTGFADPGVHHTHELFVPFRDATSGKETYGAGRYLEVDVEHGADGTETAEIDFNLAYNPYCAYSEFYSCPVPPPENTLSAPIPAGERTYGEGH